LLAGVLELSCEGGLGTAFCEHVGVRTKFMVSVVVQVVVQVVVYGVSSCSGTCLWCQ